MQSTLTSLYTLPACLVGLHACMCGLYHFFLCCLILSILFLLSSIYGWIRSYLHWATNKYILSKHVARVASFLGRFFFNIEQMVKKTGSDCIWAWLGTGPFEEQHCVGPSIDHHKAWAAKRLSMKVRPSCFSKTMYTLIWTTCHN